MVNLKRKQEEQGKIKMKEISIVDAENHTFHILHFTPILNSDFMLPSLFDFHKYAPQKNLEQIGILV